MKRRATANRGAAEFRRRPSAQYSEGDPKEGHFPRPLSTLVYALLSVVYKSGGNRDLEMSVSILDHLLNQKWRGSKPRNLGLDPRHFYMLLSRRHPDRLRTIHFMIFYGVSFGHF